MLLHSVSVLPKKHESLECRVKNLSNAVDEFHMYWGHMQNDHKHDKVGWIKNSELIYHLSDSSCSLGMFAFSQQIIIAAIVYCFIFNPPWLVRKKKPIITSFSFSCVCLCLWLREYIATKKPHWVTATWWLPHDSVTQHFVKAQVVWYLLVLSTTWLRIRF